MPMCDNDTDLYNSAAVHHLRDQGVTGAAYLGIFGRCVKLVWPRLEKRTGRSRLGTSSIAYSMKSMISGYLVVAVKVWQLSASIALTR